MKLLYDNMNDKLLYNNELIYEQSTFLKIFFFMFSTIIMFFNLKNSKIVHPVCQRSLVTRKKIKILKLGDFCCLCPSPNFHIFW